VKKAACISALCALVICALTCQKKEPAAQHAPAAEPSRVEFVAPADSIVTIDQMKKWIECNVYLDSLSFLYKDSFSVNDPAKQMACQDRFVKAEDRICVHLGITGGYPEYLWILRNLSNPKNKRIVDSLKLATFK
jgi:hypothetical protein